MTTWIQHVKNYRMNNPGVSYKDALQQASQTYHSAKPYVTMKKIPNNKRVANCIQSCLTDEKIYKQKMIAAQIQLAKTRKSIGRRDKIVAKMRKELMKPKKQYKEFKLTRPASGKFRQPPTKEKTMRQIYDAYLKRNNKDLQMEQKFKNAGLHVYDDQYVSDLQKDLMLDSPFTSTAKPKVNRGPTATYGNRTGPTILPDNRFANNSRQNWNPFSKQTLANWNPFG
jgi:hypothetical protein